MGWQKGKACPSVQFRDLRAEGKRGSSLNEVCLIWDWLLPLFALLSGETSALLARVFLA
jgi:hypothetical protein